MYDELSEIDLCAFDMDGTLYAYTPTIVANIHASQAAAVVALAHGRISAEDAHALCRKSYDETRSGWTYPARDFGISVNQLHEESQKRNPVDAIEPAPALREAFRAAADAGLKLGVITHSHLGFTTRVLARISLDDIIDPRMVVTLEQVDMREKQVDAAMFNEIARRGATLAARILTVEDSLPNLITARGVGNRTAYIHWGRPLDTLPSYVDHQFETTCDAVLAVLAARRRAGRLATRPANVLV